MSMDSVDDLEGAEDQISELWSALGQLLATPGDEAVLAFAWRALRGAESYCRATCGHMFDEPCTDEDCYCPCGHPTSAVAHYTELALSAAELVAEHTGRVS